MLLQFLVYQGDLYQGYYWPSPSVPHLGPDLRSPTLKTRVDYYLVKDSQADNLNLQLVLNNDLLLFKWSILTSCRSHLYMVPLSRNLTECSGRAVKAVIPLKLPDFGFRIRAIRDLSLQIFFAGSRMLWMLWRQIQNIVWREATRCRCVVEDSKQIRQTKNTKY